MSREMKNFADYFMQGLQLGGKWANDWEAKQIAKQRNALTEARNKAQDARENRKLDLYGHGVMASAELARARAQAALRPKGGGGGGGGGAAGTSADAAALLREANERGIIVTPQAAPAGNTINITQGSNDGGSDAPVATPPAAEAPPVERDSRGGMVGSKRYASGGIVEGMSLEEADKYRDAGSGRSKAKAADPFGGAMSAAAGKDYKTTRDEAGAIRPVGPVGSGAGGSYTTADTGPGGVASTNYNRGGAVQGGGWYAKGGMVRFQEGGMVDGQDLTAGYDWKAAEKEREQKTQAAQTEQVAQQAQQVEEEKTKRQQGGDFSTSFASALDGGSADGATGSGGDSTGGVSGSGGVGGSATGGAGGSAAAGTSGDAGSDGGGTYRRGGQVRRFQSGGRVLREPTAIDTGTTGPMSGYGYQAAPPANARRR